MWVDVQYAKLFEVRNLHRFHGIGDMAECIDADVAKRLGIRHSTDAEEIENNDKNAVIRGTFCNSFLGIYWFYTFAYCMCASFQSLFSLTYTCVSNPAMP